MRLAVNAIPYPDSVNSNNFGDFTRLICLVAGESRDNSQEVPPSGKIWIAFGVDRAGKVMLKPIEDQAILTEIFSDIAWRTGTGVVYDSTSEEQYATKLLKPSLN